MGVGLAKVSVNIQDLFKKPFVYSKTTCPFMSSVNIPNFCEEDCALFVIRKNNVTGNIGFAGCALHWLAVADTK